MIIGLVIISGILIFFNIRAIKKEKSKSFDNILKDKECTVDKNDIEMIKLRKDLSETIVEIQRDMVTLKDEIEYLKFQNYELKNQLLNEKEKKDKNSSKIKDENFEENLKQNDNKVDDSKASKINEVKRLIELKKSDEEICKLLHIGRGELLLIKGLYK